jgi:putative membrane protein
MYRGWNGGSWTLGGHALGFPWGGLVMGLLFFALIALIVFAIVRMGKSSATSLGVAKDRGIDILIERYARGEIDADTFRAMKAVIDAKN